MIPFDTPDENFIELSLLSDVHAEKVGNPKKM
jgi:hypothetical protein